MFEATQETSAAPELTDFQKWDQVPEAEKEAASAPGDEAVEEPIEGAKTAPESAPEKETQEPEEEEEKLPRGLRKRFRELTSEIRDLRTKLTVVPATEKGAASQPETKQEAATGEPAAENFDTYEKYIKAFTEWQLDQREAKRAQAERQRVEADAAKQKNEAWNARVKEAKAELDDYEEVIEQGSALAITQAMHSYIVESEIGPKLAYKLAGNPAEVARIAKLSPTQAIKELGKIEDALTAAKTDTEQPKTAVSKAPKPPATVTGRAPADPAGKEPDPKDFAKWSKWKDRQERLAEAD